MRRHGPLSDRLGGWICISGPVRDPKMQGGPPILSPIPRGGPPVLIPNLSDITRSELLLSGCS